MLDLAKKIYNWPYRQMGSILLIAIVLLLLFSGCLCFFRKCNKGLQIKEKIKIAMEGKCGDFPRVIAILCIALLTIGIVGMDLLADWSMVSEWKNLPHDVTVEDYAISGYTLENGVYVNQFGGTQVQLSELNQYIGYVKITFDQPLESEMNITVYYAESGQAYSEDYKSYEVVLPGTTELGLPIKKYIANCCIRIGTEVGQRFDLGQIILNPADSKPELLEKETAVIILAALIALVVLGRSEPVSEGNLETKSEHIRLDQTEKLYLLLCFVVYFIWSVSFTGNLATYGPDEGMRYDIPKFIFENGKLPYGWEESIRDANYGFSYGFDINLPYLTSALFMWLTSLFTTDQTALLIAARFTSVLSTVGVSYYTILLSKKFFRDNPLRWVFVFFVTMIPQLVFLASYVNLDSFSLFTAVFIINAWVCGLETEWDIKSCVRLAIGLGVCFIAYKFVYSYILVSFILCCLWWWINRKRVSPRDMIYRALLIIAIVLLICGWKFIRNALIYEGNFMGMGETSPYAELYAVDRLKPEARKMATFRYKGYSICEMLRDSSWISLTSKSYFSLLGWMTIFADDWVYRGYFTAFWVGISGTMVHCFSKIRNKEYLQLHKGKLLLIVTMFSAAAITFFISVYFSWDSDFQPQGRYIISTLPFVASMITFGINGWINLISGQNEHIKNMSRKLVAAEMCAFVILTMLEGYLNCLSALLD